MIDLNRTLLADSINSANAQFVYWHEGLIDGRITNDYVRKLVTKDKSWFDIDYVDLAGTIVSSIVSEIPYVGSFLSALISFFWPKNEKDIFSEIKERIEQLVNQKIDGASWARLIAKCNEVRAKLDALSQLLQTGNAESVNNHYKELTSYLVGIEENFKITGSDNNPTTFIPLYCMIVNLTVSFRLLTINKPEDYGLTEKDIEAERILLNELILGTKGAYGYVSDIKDSFFETKSMFDDLDFKEGRTAFSSWLMKNALLSRAGMTDAHINAWKLRAVNPTNLDYIPLSITLPMPFEGLAGNSIPTCGKVYDYAMDVNNSALSSVSIFSGSYKIDMFGHKNYYWSGFDIGYLDGENEHYGYNVVNTSSLSDLGDNNPLSYFALTFDPVGFGIQLSLGDGGFNMITAGGPFDAEPYVVYKLGESLYKIQKIIVYPAGALFDVLDIGGALPVFTYNNLKAESVININ